MIKNLDMVIVHYGDDQMIGTVTDVKRNADKSVRLVGVQPGGTTHTAWFAPTADPFTFASVGGATTVTV